MSVVYIQHKCLSCGFEDELPAVNGKIQCPYCDTIEDLSKDNEVVTKQNLKDKHKILRKLLKYGKEYD